jgi:very-short-patch-repair endonuclease
MTLSELLHAGLTPDAIAHRVTQDRLQRLCTGVYRIGPGSLALAAVKSCTSPAWVTNRWGMYVLGFVPLPDLPVDVVVEKGSRRGRPGLVRVHHGTTLEPRDFTTRHGIPVVAAARAILDAAETHRTAEVEEFIARAQAAGLLTEQRLRDRASRAGRSRGAGRVMRILADHTGVTRSEAERILRRLLRDAGLEAPVTDYGIGRYRADFAWPDKKLIVEFDGFATHGTRKAFHHDRKRNAELTALGWSVMQVTAQQLANEPLAVVARIAEALAVRG